MTPKHDNDENDEQGTIRLTATSTDPRYAGEKASVNYRITDDDELAALDFSYVSRPVFVADSDGNTDETNGYDDDAYVKLTARFTARNTDPCYVEYIYLDIKAQDMVTHSGHPMSDKLLDDFPLGVPYGDSIYWTITQKSGYQEYTTTTWPGLTYQHYDDGIRDSVLIYEDNSPGQAAEGVIKSYAVGNMTNCNGNRYRLHTVDVPLDGSYPTRNPDLKYGPYYRVNFPVE